jgi:hypothetical protein
MPLFLPTKNAEEPKKLGRENRVESHCGCPVFVDFLDCRKASVLVEIVHEKEELSRGLSFS